MLYGSTHSALCIHVSANCVSLHGLLYRAVRSKSTGELSGAVWRELGEIGATYRVNANSK